MSSYQTLYSMPCRLPCQRYIDGDTLFEAKTKVQSLPKEAFDGGEYEPTISRESYVYNNESYEYDPTVSGETYKPINISTGGSSNYGTYLKEGGKSTGPTITSKKGAVEKYEGEEGAQCDCGPMNRNYRMESCGYNQSPTWDYHRSFNNSMARAPTETFENGAECGCAPKNPPYRMETCGYNQSPTWTDQSQFRNTLQNRPF